jgi:hypothetical protein
MPEAFCYLASDLVTPAIALVAFAQPAFDESVAIPEGAAAARSAETDAVSGEGRERRVPSRRLPECVAVHEYTRFFGIAPTRDFARLRHEGLAPGDGAR